MYKIARKYEKYGEEAHVDDVTSQLKIVSVVLFVKPPS